MPGAGRRGLPAELRWAVPSIHSEIGCKLKLACCKEKLRSSPRVSAGQLPATDQAPSVTPALGSAWVSASGTGFRAPGWCWASLWERGALQARGDERKVTPLCQPFCLWSQWPRSHSSPRAQEKHGCILKEIPWFYGGTLVVSDDGEGLCVCKLLQQLRAR